MNSDEKFMLKKHRKNLTHQMPTDLRREIESQFAKEPSRLWFWRGGLTFASALALCLTFVVGRFTALENPQDQVATEVVAGHVRSLMATHLSDVISTDKHTVKPWFEGRLDFGPDVKDFAEKEFPLIGGRLDYLDSRTAAALVYKHGQHVINVFEWPVSETLDSSPRFVSRRGYQLFTWRHSGLQYWAVSDLNATDLQSFVGYWQ